jgi:hypothetical protein
MNAKNIAKIIPLIKIKNAISFILQYS